MQHKLKPYMIVHVTVDDPHVEQGRRHYFGEAMSYPTPQGTIMVRRVPGLAATLDEVPVSAVAIPEPKLRNVYVHYGVVEGGKVREAAGRRVVNRFPVDMLRYDSCVPVNFALESDQWSGPRAVLEDGHTELIVARVRGVQEPGWTYARWTSFLARLRPLKSDRVIMAS